MDMGKLLFVDVRKKQNLQISRLRRLACRSEVLDYLIVLEVKPKKKDRNEDREIQLKSALGLLF